MSRVRRKSMNFEFTTSHVEFREELRDWLVENLPSGWKSGDRSIPAAPEERAAFLQEWQRTLFDGGWAGVHWPEEYGGRGSTLMEQAIYQRELSRVDAPPTLNIIGIDLLGPTLIEMGSEEQKDRFIPHILNGDEIWCQGYSEPDHGSDIAGLETRAELEGEEYVINGQKIWTSNAHVADWCILMTRTDFSGTKHEGITALILDLDQPGVTIEPIKQITGESDFNQVYFDDAVVPDEEVYIVGEVGEGWDVIRTISSFEHAGTRAHSVFNIERRFKEIVEYCKQETRDGVPLSSVPRVRQRLAEFDTRLESLIITYFRNLSKQMETGSPGAEGSMYLVSSDELSIDLGQFVMNQVGLDSGLWEDGPEDGRWTNEFLRAYGMWIAAGTGDIQRNIIGERVLELPKDMKSNETHRRG